MNPKREELIEILGGKICKHCRITDPRILQIDHVFGNGQEMPLSKADIIDLYLDNPYLANKELHVLCCNCHRIKSLENGDLGRRKTPDIGIKVKLEEFRRRNLQNIDWYR